MRILLCLTLLCAVAAATSMSYDGSKVLRAYPATHKQLMKLKRWALLDERLDFWTSPVSIGSPVDFMVKKSLVRTISYKLKKSKIPFTIAVENVQKLIDEVESGRTDSAKVDFNQYNRYDAIRTFIENTAASCSRCEIFDIGTSFEGRPMKVIKIGAGTNKPGMFFECGIHAREWISPAVCINMINKLANDYDSDSQVKEMLDRYDWYFSPVSNPDGYEFTHTNQRLWRKTRSENPGSSCRGTDPNRNWGYRWGESGSSTNPCSDIFMGSRAFSEKETANIRDFVTARADRMRMYMSVHSFGQYFLIPWSYSIEYPTDFDDLKEAGDVGANALRQVHGMTYTVGHSAVLLGATAGSSDDWAKGGANIKFAYTLELRDRGFYGFILPADQIQPTFEEVWAAMYAMHNHFNTNWPM